MVATAERCIASGTAHLVCKEQSWCCCRLDVQLGEKMIALLWEARWGAPMTISIFRKLVIGALGAMAVLFSTTAFAQGTAAVSYTHLTLPTKRIV